MRAMKEEHGQMLVLVALSMTVLLGFLALAVDVGLLFRAKRTMQVAADAAAVPESSKLHYAPAPRVVQEQPA
jgi:uncharacterized membrane protein